jgi:hypothetical protein
VRIAAYIFLAFGIFLLASAGYDQFRGSTRVSSGRYTRHYTVTREASPEKFHDAMTYHWAFGALLLVGGVVIYSIDKRQEESDPLSPDHDDET